MRLSSLFTEDLIAENHGILKNLAKHANRAFGRAKKTPNPRELRIKQLIEEVYQEIWGDYHDDPKALARISSYKNSIQQHMSKFLQIKDRETLRHEIEMLFRARAERVPYSL